MFVFGMCTIDSDFRMTCTAVFEALASGDYGMGGPCMAGGRGSGLAIRATGSCEQFVSVQFCS